MNKSTERLFLPQSAIAVLIACGLIAGILLAAGHKDYPQLHTILDTGMTLLTGVLALLLWDMGVRVDRSFPRWLAIGFAVTSVVDSIHVMVTVDWAGPLAWVTEMRDFLRPVTWPPTAHVLPIGIAGAIWLMRRGRTEMLGYAVAMVVAAAGLLAAFHWLPTYTPPGPLGITRPALILVPLLWAIVAAACWRLRAADRLLQPLAAMAGVLLLGNVVMLYSQAPHDTEAMVAHLGRVTGGLVLLMCLMEMASGDMLERIRAEEKVARLNEELEQRVIERTAQIESTNRALKSEIAVRRQAEQKTQAQVSRLNLLHEITRAIGERQGLTRLFHLVVESLEKQLPADFVCICFHDTVDNTLALVRIGARGGALAPELAIPERARVGIDRDGLSRCIGGELIYEQDIGQADSPFLRRLAQVGLRSVVLAPLQTEQEVFGVLVVGRGRTQAFGNDECDFLQQLGEHLALVVHQAQL